jgi:GNAT superfamily N-acetyltransferase
LESRIPDLNLFMMCEALEESAVSAMPDGFHVRTCRKSELDVWMAMHFDDAESAREHRGYMADFFRDVYSGQGDRFYQECRFVCDAEDVPVGTCFAWKAYGRITTLHWFKVLKSHEGKGIGRALLSVVMQGLAKEDFPVYLHTQPSSFRAIKLYSDFGFRLLEDPTIGSRTNDLAQCLPILKDHMTNMAFRGLRTVRAPDSFLLAVASSDIVQF